MNEMLKLTRAIDVLPGRKLTELRAYSGAHPDFLLLNPKAVVMDLAQAYHTWIRECFPNAIRIADRFHVHGYVIESVQEVRRTIQNTLSPRAKAYLKANHRLLNPPAESFNEDSKKRLKTLLSYSPLLRSVWEWKEAFTTWYDSSPTFTVAKQGFERWFEQGDRINHAAVRSALLDIKRYESRLQRFVPFYAIRRIKSSAAVLSERNSHF
ncbi:transposase [Paenibacillus sp. MBLB4367]|uniref:transposase n=1 Tax=Paenibacillus sp. MBLB4367 TaxID=3384767 RepID=UPI0039080754